MSHMNRHDQARCEEEIVANALRLIADDDRGTAVPAQIETAVMRAWNVRERGAAEPHRWLRRPLWSAALVTAACAVLAAALWVERSSNSQATQTPNPESVQQTISTDAFRYSLEAIATTGVLLQEDPSSLHVVRLSVQPSVLAASGYPLVDPLDTEPMDVEVLVGLDGVPRAIRRVESNARWSTQ